MATKAHYSEKAGSQNRVNEALYMVLPPQELVDDDDDADFHDDDDDQI